MKTIGLLVFIILTTYQYSIGQLYSNFPEATLNSVVLLEKKIDSVFVPHGTGFLIYNYDSINDMNVITNEHILRNKSIYVTLPAEPELVEYMNYNSIKSIMIRNTEWELYGEKLRHEFELIENETFVCNRELDIATFKIAIGTYVTLTDTTVLKISSIKGVPKSMIKSKEEVPLGTNIYFIGFPFSIGTELGFYHKGFTGMFSESVPNPLVRSGSVAWASEKSDIFLLDALSYSGNSGSPVFTKQDIGSKPYLIGIVRGHLPSEESDNIGLATCIWSDAIIKLLERLN